jgi:hypothetical protein
VPTGFLPSSPEDRLLIAPPERMEAIWRAMALGLGDYVNKNGFLHLLREPSSNNLCFRLTKDIMYVLLMVSRLRRNLYLCIACTL